MPLYNGEKYIKKALLSVINQSYENLEIIVIDDCSNDNSLEIVLDLKEKYKNRDIKVFKNDINQGLIKNRNKGAKLARGEYIMSFDYDDYMAPNHIEIMLSEFEDDVSFVHCNTIFIDEDDNIIKVFDNHEEKEYWNKHFMVFASFRNFVSGAGAVISKKYLEMVGGWEEKYRNFGDWYLWIKLAKVGKPKYTKKTYGYYRQHKNESNMHSQTLKDPKFIDFKKECANLAKSYINNLSDQILHKNIILQNKIKNFLKSA
jgi:glycosyltransferase involved in cell wall biosynthesis